MRSYPFDGSPGSYARVHGTRLRDRLFRLTHVRMCLHDEPAHRTHRWVPKWRLRLRVSTELKNYRRGGWTRP